MAARSSIIFLSIVLLLQFINTKAAPPDPVNQAKALLDQLRKVTDDALIKAFKDYSATSDLVNSAALETKIRSPTPAVIQCVNHRTEDAKKFIFNAGISAIAHVKVPNSEKEKALISCGTNQGCINGLIKELESAIKSLPDVVNGIITVDRNKVNEQVSLIKACLSHIKGHPEITPPKSVDDVKALLGRLRQITLDNLNLESTPLINLIDVVYSTAQETKARGGGHNLIKCVNDHASEAIDAIYTADSKLTEKYMRAISDAEQKWVLCEVTDLRCIHAVITDIGSIIHSTPGDIKNDVQVAKENVDKHIATIKLCGSPK